RQGRSSSPWTKLRARLAGDGARRAFEELLRRVAATRFPQVAEHAVEVSQALPPSETPLLATVSAKTLDRRPRPTAAANQGARLLFVSAMFPSAAHAGGLRLLDLIQHLSPRHPIDLIAPYREKLDGPSWERLRPHLQAVE